MAATSEAPARRGGLNLGQPGAKEYLIVGGTALGLALLYFWWQRRHGGTSQSAPATGSAPSTPTGLSTAQFSAFLRDFASSTTTRTRDRDKDADRDRDDRDKDRRRRDRDKDKDKDDRDKRWASA